MEVIELGICARNVKDEGVVLITLTNEGRDLRERTVEVPLHIRGYMQALDDEFREMYRLFYRLFDSER